MNHINIQSTAEKRKENRIKDGKRKKEHADTHTHTNRSELRAVASTFDNGCKMKKHIKPPAIPTAIALCFTQQFYVFPLKHQVEQMFSPNRKYKTENERTGSGERM